MRRRERFLVCVRREEEYKMFVGGKVPQVSFCQKTSSSSERYYVR